MTIFFASFTAENLSVSSLLNISRSFISTLSVFVVSILTLTGLSDRLLAGAHGYSLQSQINFKGKTVDGIAREGAYPLFSHLEYYDFELKSGEMLYFPFGTLHQVTTEEDTVSVNIFCGNENGEDFVAKLFHPPYREVNIFLIAT
jgi:hypothetical protein